jgi:hypothetical protein
MDSRPRRASNHASRCHRSIRWEPHTVDVRHPDKRMIIDPTMNSLVGIGLPQISARLIGFLRGTIRSTLAESLDGPELRRFFFARVVFSPCLPVCAHAQRCAPRRLAHSERAVAPPLLLSIPFLFTLQIKRRAARAHPSLRTSSEHILIVRAAGAQGCPAPLSAPLIPSPATHDGG